MTGKVRQITDGPAISHPSYFLQSSFFPGGKSMFFTSYRSGNAQLWKISLETNETRQLTHGAPIHPYSPALHPNGKDLIVTRGGSLWTVSLHNKGSDRLIFEAIGAELGECSISPDGEWLTAAYKRGNESGLIVGRFDGSGWHAIPFPRTVIHPQFHPLDPTWIEFAGDPAPRMHRVRRDGTGLACLYQHGNDEFIVHETFLRSTGDIVDFMRGCDLFDFKDLEPFQSEIRRQTHAPRLTPQQLARKAGCPKLTIVNTRWVQ